MMSGHVRKRREIRLSKEATDSGIIMGGFLKEYGVYFLVVGYSISIAGI